MRPASMADRRALKAGLGQIEPDRARQSQTEPDREGVV
jgi:hypothetical protein